jgi:hypothetical protein
MEAILGSTVPVFIGLTVVLFGGAAWMTGQAVANAWQPFGLVAGFYCLLLAAGNRFLAFALFEEPLLSLSGFIADAVVIVLVCLFAHRLTMARKMVTQYPWLYERSGLFAWRERSRQG